MLRDMLYEESASSTRGKREEKFYTFFLVLAVGFFVAAGIAVFFAVPFIQGIVTDGELSASGKAFNIGFMIFLVVVCLVSGIICWFVRKRFNVSFDYTFVEDELRVTKVFNGKSRKKCVTISSVSILKIGWCEKSSYRDVLRGIDGKPILLTPNAAPADGKQFVYLLVSGSLGKKLYVLECRQILMEYIVQSAGIDKLERE